jgi:hypothetical protein
MRRQLFPIEVTHVGLDEVLVDRLPERFGQQYGGLHPLSVPVRHRNVVRHVDPRAQHSRVGLVHIELCVPDGRAVEQDDRTALVVNHLALPEPPGEARIVEKLVCRDLHFAALEAALLHDAEADVLLRWVKRAQRAGVTLDLLGAERDPTGAGALEIVVVLDPVVALGFEKVAVRL